jgi:hypothetical protein
MLRVIRATLLGGLLLLGSAASTQAQSCWDTSCAAGTPAADCWRAWCVDGWSYPAYPYRPAGWYRADPYSVPPYTPPAWLRQVSPLRSAPGCRPAPVLDQVLWGC